MKVWGFFVQGFVRNPPIDAVNYYIRVKSCIERGLASTAINSHGLHLVASALYLLRNLLLHTSVRGKFNLIHLLYTEH